MADTAHLDGQAPSGATARAPSGHVLVLGDDMRIFLTVTRALGRTGRPVHAAPFERDAPALRSRYIHRIHDLPDFARDPEGWREAVAGIVRSCAIDLVIPCTDRPILALNATRGAFAPAVVAIPSPRSMDVFFDKAATHEVCRAIGVPVLDAARLDEAGGAAAIEARFAIPLVIKPRRSVFADRPDEQDKVHIVESRRQLEAVLAGVRDPSRLLVERYFEGQGIGLSVLADRGEVIQAFQHRRLREGKGGCSSYRVSEPVDAAMLEACARLCRHTGHHGVCMFELRRNPADGAWVLIEVNCRFWGSMPLPVSLGLDFPNRLYDLLVLGRRHAPLDYPAGVRSRNHVLDGFNLVKRLREGGRGALAPLALDALGFAAQPLRWLTGSERNDSFVRDDPAPALAELAGLPGGIRRKLRAR